MCTKVARFSNFYAISIGEFYGLFTVKNTFHPLRNTGNNFVGNGV